MQGYIDCHCHISSGDFDDDIDEVIGQSKKTGVLALVAVAEHAGDFEKIIQLSQRFPGFILPCLGVHPVQEDPAQPRGALPEDLDLAIPLIEQYKDQIVAIGEVRHLVKQVQCTCMLIIQTFFVLCAGWP